MIDCAHLKRLLALFLVFSATIHPVRFAQAQSGIQLIIDEVDAQNFPNIEVYISILGAQGNPVSNITPADISVSEDRQAVPTLEVLPTFQHPLEFVLIVDTSQSMAFGEGPTPIQNTIAVAKDLVVSFGAQDRIALIAFSDRVTLIQGLTGDKNLISSGLDSLQTSGNASINDALMQAVEILRGNSRRPHIVLITDSVESGNSIFSFDEAVDNAIRNAIVVHTVGWNAADENALAKISQLTGGRTQWLQGFQPDTLAFMAAFNQLANSLEPYRQQYRLAFQSQLPADGAEHELFIKIDHLGSHIEQTRRFFAEPRDVLVNLPFQDGQTVCGNVYISPEFTSPAPIEQLDILIDGQTLETVFSPPYEYKWDSTTILPGQHNLTLMAQDSAGNSGQASANLLVEPATKVNITNPAGGSTVTGLVDITAVVDACSKIARVEFFVNGDLINTLENPPYETSWSTINAAAGGYEIKVKASDVNDFADEDLIRVNVAGGNEFGGFGVIVAAALALVVIAIPLGLRARKRLRTRTEAAASAGGVGLQAEAPYTMQARLREIEGINPAQEWVLPIESEIRLGRKRDANDIPLQGATASRRQAIIRYQDGNFLIFNLRTENPILIDGVPIAQQYVLKHGDTIQAGESTFRFEVVG